MFATATTSNQVLTLDDTGIVLSAAPAGDYPDGLAYDRGTAWPAVAAESGDVTVLIEKDRHLSVLGRDHLADGAHLVAVDPTTHCSYFPIANGPGGHPVLLVGGDR